MLTCEGPIGKINYQGWGDFIFMKKPFKNKKTKIGLCAGGSGLTPMYSIAQASSLAKDGAEITFMFSNKTKNDIFCEKELNELGAMNDKFKHFHTLTRHNAEAHGEWSGLTGRFDFEMFQKCSFPAPADDVLILTCGPSGFNTAIKDFLKANGYTEGEHFV